jgi:hypothetical protein
MSDTVKKVLKANGVYATEPESICMKPDEFK